MADARLRDLERAALTDPLAAARLKLELARLGWCPEGCRDTHPEPEAPGCDGGEHVIGTRCAICAMCAYHTWAILAAVEPPDPFDPDARPWVPGSRDRSACAKSAAQRAVEADPCPVRRAAVLEAARPWPHDFAWTCAVARYGSPADALASHISRASGLRVPQYSYSGSSNTGSGTILRLDSPHGDPQPPR